MLGTCFASDVHPPVTSSNPTMRIRAPHLGSFAPLYLFIDQVDRRLFTAHEADLITCDLWLRFLNRDESEGENNHS